MDKGVELHLLLALVYPDDRMAQADNRNLRLTVVRRTSYCVPPYTWLSLHKEAGFISEMAQEADYGRQCIVD